MPTTKEKALFLQGALEAIPHQHEGQQTRIMNFLDDVINNPDKRKAAFLSPERRAAKSEAMTIANKAASGHHNNPAAQPVAEEKTAEKPPIPATHETTSSTELTPADWPGIKADLVTMTKRQVADARDIPQSKFNAFVGEMQAAEAAKP